MREKKNAETIMMQNKKSQTLIFSRFSWTFEYNEVEQKQQLEKPQRIPIITVFILQRKV